MRGKPVLGSNIDLQAEDRADLFAGIERARPKPVLIVVLPEGSEERSGSGGYCIPACAGDLA